MEEGLIQTRVSIPDQTGHREWGSWKRCRKTRIAITRQMVSGGTYIGHLVARRLGFQYVDLQALARGGTAARDRRRELESLDQRLVWRGRDTDLALTVGAP